ncbi:adenylate kinase family protein [Natrinema halophilum]|uniref:Putative adenylate kinase n=1 Tax=Natrinema halophilum TaxID=1699371 RepID=A0A7D5GFR6_9EURY|nr:AAA family ATPase [Natrinema halophilum]QLG47814.1 AAA family ATPase [Natrinema halophilum]
MKIAVTGTPGTGKTTATELLRSRLDSRDSNEDDGSLADLEVVHLNRVLEDEALYTDVDADRESKIADLEAISEWLQGRESVVFESHLAHHFEADRVAVLRCRPAILEQRLHDRGESERKAHENAESEALDVILSEAVEEHGLESIYEIDTTDLDSEGVADELAAVALNEREPSAGEVNFMGYLT